MSTTPHDDDDRTRIVPQTGGARPAVPETQFPPTQVDPALAPTRMTTVTPHLDTSAAAPPPPPAPKPSSPSASSAGDSGNALPIGTYLAEFELTGVIGEGGFGIVYHAWDHSLQRKVALKEYMPASLASREGATVRVRSQRHKETFDAGLKSFINEARLLAQFDHPSLVKVYRFWEANGTAYMVMPLYVGTTLKDRLRALGGRPDEAWLIGLLAPLTEALQVIHRENCFHRDIAPDNVILLEGSERPLLLDFGAARRVIGDMTQALTVILKPGYAPVEQYAESPDMKQGAWTDVYALAATVHWAILGRTPPPSVSRLMTDSFEPLASTAAGQYSAGFLQAIDRALAVRPEQRTQSIEALRADLGISGSSGSGGSSGIRDVATTRIATATPPPAATPRTVARDDSFDKTLRVDPARAPTPAPAAAGSGGSGRWIAIGAAVLALGAGGGYLAFSGKPAPAPAASTAPPAAAPGAAPVVAPAPVPAPAPAPAPTFSLRDEFERAMAGQTPDFVVSAAPARSQLRIGRDKLAFNVSSNRDGHVTILLRGPDGSLTLLFPNEQAKDTRIRAGQTKQLPDPSWPLVASEPAGSEQFLVFVSSVPRDYADFGHVKEYIFHTLPVDERLAKLAAGWSRPTPLLLGAPPKDCTGDACNAYGAAMFTVEVLR